MPSVERSGLRGFTLAELMISLFIMTFLVLIGLAAFQLTTNLFQASLLRQSTENQIRSVKSLLERDFALTNSWLMARVERRGANARDAVALPTLSDWKDPANFDPDNGRPAWNRYVVWYANNSERGLLVRQVVAPALPADGFFSAPYADLSVNLSETDPLTNQDLIYSKALSNDVVDFQVDAFEGASRADVRLKLLATGARRAGGLEQAVEVVEVTLKFDIKNTWPRL
jgi:type II secretory pathway pseudopilin PulG